ncbi:MAG: PorT family protein [Gemmatimonadetes bacterium]|nr:PorT family protein [Gemmatimonadota bacterium]
MRASKIATTFAGLAAVASLVATPLAAQSKSMPWTIIAGINIAGVSDPPAGASVGDKTGLVVGAGTSFALSKDLHLAPEALFQMQGFTSGTASVSVYYLNVPVLFRYNFAPTGESGMMPYINAGPNLALKLSCSVSGVPGSSTCSPSPKSFDLGLMFGGGLEFKSGTNTFGVGLRYQLGLTDAVDGQSGKNKAIQIIGTWKIK